MILDDSIENEDGDDFGDDRATTADLDIAHLIQRSAESEREDRAEAESDWQPPSEDDTDWQPPSEGDADGEGGDTDGKREGDTDGEDGDTDGETDGDTASMNTSDTEEPALPNINNRGRTRGRGRGRGRGVQVSSCTRGDGRGRGRGRGGGRATSGVREFDESSLFVPKKNLPFLRLRGGGGGGGAGQKVAADSLNPVDFFKLYLTEGFVRMLVRETNEYAKQTINAAKAKGPLTKYARFKDWKEVDSKTMEQFIGLQLLTGLVSKPSSHTGVQVPCSTPLCFPISCQETGSRNFFISGTQTTMWGNQLVMPQIGTDYTNSDQSSAVCKTDFKCVHTRERHCN